VGKWSKLKGTLTKFSQPQTWQEKIDEVKKTLSSKNRIELCKELTEVERKKDELKEKISECNTHEEAINQILVDMLEGEGETSIKNMFGTFFIKDDPYCSIENKHDFMGWIHRENMTEILSVHYSTMAGIVKTRLESGDEIPSGIKVYMKTSIGHRSPKD
jgi:hypothetical protein